MLSGSRSSCELESWSLTWNIFESNRWFSFGKFGLPWTSLASSSFLAAVDSCTKAFRGSSCEPNQRRSYSTRILQRLSSAECRKSSDSSLSGFPSFSESSSSTCIIAISRTERFVGELFTYRAQTEDASQRPADKVDIRGEGRRPGCPG
jgi:hypothetical protein